MRTFSVVCAWVISGLATSLLHAETPWPCFRGMDSGKSEAKGLPLTWSETENTVWKTEIPGLGHSSPVVADNQIWLTTSPDKGITRHLLRIDFVTGKIINDYTLFTYPRATNEICHQMNSHATPTPIIDDHKIYVSFGNPGIACLDTKTGEKIWERRDITNNYHDVGGAATPIMAGDKLIVINDGHTNALHYVIALDKKTGKTLWRTDRVYPTNHPKPYMTHAFCPPLVMTVNHKQQLISPSAHGARAYDLESGKELWYSYFKGWSVVPQPSQFGNLAIMCNGVVGDRQIMAVHADRAAGDITGTDAIAWRVQKHVPDMASPVLVGNRLYAMSPTVLSCIDPLNGTVLWTGKVAGQHIASPLVADGYLYLFNRKGGSTVVKLGETFAVAATNTLAEGCSATPAIYGKSLIVRTEKHLYRIEKKTP